MDRALCLQTVRDANVTLGNWGGQAGERPDTPIFINVRVRQTNGPAGEPEEGEIDLCFALTVPQMALIVKDFFCDITVGRKNIFAQMLSRLLRKRWAVMTSSLAKDPNDPIFGEDGKFMQYSNL